MTDVSCAQDHPVISRSCYMLHPCQTASLLELLLPSLYGEPAMTERAQAIGRYTACVAQPAAASAARAGELVSPEQERPAAGSGEAASWQLRYMLAWWSIIGPVVKLALPAMTRV